MTSSFPMAARLIPFALLYLAFAAPLNAQTPTKCLEIESILVDACNPTSTCPGAEEGENEMVRFKTGPQETDIDDLEADWPNGTWRGLVQNNTTASLTSQLNATIESCGWLLEPPGGIIPPGSTVLLVTSTDMCVAGNSFSALSDTLYLIFQNAGNTAGHFANTPAAGDPISPTPPPGNSVRSLILFYNPTNCSDTASYVRELLLNDQGSYGGEGGESDGGTAVFTWPGVPQVSYVNYGCQAPFDPLFVQAEVDGVLCGGTGTVSVSANVIGGTFTSVLWQGGTGTFADPTALSTTYTAGAGDVGSVVLQLCAQTDCADPICGSVTVPGGSGPTITITGDGPLAICPGDDVALTASGADTYVWSTTETTPTITVAAVGTYSVTGTNACGTGTAEAQVTPGSGLTVTITGDLQVCPGGTTTLTASGATTYIWSTGDLGPSTTVSAPGTYTVMASSNCGSVTQAATVTQATGISVTVTGDTQICEDGSSVLTASGADTYVWSTSDVGPSITVNTAGTYTVTGTNGCGSDDASIEVFVGIAPVVTILGDPSFCDGQSTMLTASGADSYQWSTSATDPTISVNQPGMYSVTGTNACGSNTASATVTVAEPPVVDITGDETICPDGQAVLTATGVGTITWNTGAQGSVLTVTQPGLYVATITNACGSDSQGFTVSAIDLSADFTSDPISGTYPLTVAFTPVDVPDGAEVLWDFDDDGSTSTVLEPQHTFEEPGSYTVTLEVTALGCSTTSSAVITVTVPAQGTVSSIVLPNVFSPNGDRLNDLLVMNAVNITSVEILIFNRWGQMVNDLMRVGESWDGRSKTGEHVPDGTYFYTLTAQGRDGKSYDTTGHITLLR